MNNSKNSGMKWVSKISGMLTAVLLFTAVGSTAEATECYRDICVGDLVEDVSGWHNVTAVVDIEGSLFKVEFHNEIYTRQYSSITLFARGGAYEPVESVRCGNQGICVNDLVQDRRGNRNVLRVIEITNQAGKIEYTCRFRGETYYRNDRSIEPY